MTFLKILIGLALLATIAVLFAGVFNMSRGGEFSRQRSNRLMRFRIIAQFVTVLLIALFAILASGS